MKRLRRLLLVLTAVLLGLILLLFIFLSPIVKYLIEKYDVEYTGREITIDKLFLNLFSGNASITGLTIYEKDGKTAFFRCAEAESSIVLKKILAGTYDIRYFRAKSPAVRIVQRGAHFNYDDLWKRFAADEPAPASKKDEKPLPLYLRNIEISDFSVTYENTLPYNKVLLNKGSLRIPLIAWNDPVNNIGLDFSVGSGGSIQSQTRYHSGNGNYSVKLDVKQFDIRSLLIYLKDYMKVNALEGQFSTSLIFNGNANKPDEVAASGNLLMEKFSITDNTNEKLMACNSLEVKMDSINTGKNHFDFSTITLQQPYVNFAMYDDGFNYERIMKDGPPAATSNTGTDTAAVYANVLVMMSEYLKELVADYIVSSYNADRLEVKGGKLVFSDYTLEDKFRYELDSLQLLSDRISSTNSRITLQARSQINRSGKLEGALYISPDNYKDLEFDASVSNLKISDFNPYSKYYVATPFLNGDVFYTNKTTIHNRQLNNQNELVVYRIKAGKKVKNKTAYKIPVRLAVSLLKDVKGDIHLKIPVTGSLDDPKFKWGKIVWKVLGNLMTKAATAPFRLLAGKFGGSDTDYKEIPFSYEQTTLNAKQVRQLENLVTVVQKEEGVKLEFILMVNSEDEYDQIATSIAKRRFLNYNDTVALSKEQQAAYDQVSLKDSAFQRFLESKLGTTRLQSVQEKCRTLVGKEKVEALARNRSENRGKLIYQFFTSRQVPPEKLVFSRPSKDNEPLPRNEPPKYIINVASDDDGESPDNKKQ